MTNLAFREATKDDMPFIFSTWLKAFRYSSEFAKHIDSEIYYMFHHKLIELVFARSPKVLVACDELDNTVIYGWVCGHGPVVHFAYVKKPFRHLGIGGKLLEQYGPFQYITHLTKEGKKFIDKNPEVKYNPYVIEI